MDGPVGRGVVALCHEQLPKDAGRRDGMVSQVIEQPLEGVLPTALPLGRRDRLGLGEEVVPSRRRDAGAGRLDDDGLLRGDIEQVGHGLPPDAPGLGFADPLEDAT